MCVARMLGSPVSFRLEVSQLSRPAVDFVRDGSAETLTAVGTLADAVRGRGEAVSGRDLPKMVLLGMG